MFEYRIPFDRGLGARGGLDDLFHGMDRLFREIDRDMPLASFGHAPAQIEEKEDRFVLVIDLPGAADADVKVDVHQGVLTVSAQRQGPTFEGHVPLRRERAPLRFSRSYALGDRIDAEKTTAVIRDGVLTVEVAKSAAGQKRSIAVRAT